MLALLISRGGAIIRMSNNVIIKKSITYKIVNYSMILKIPEVQVYIFRI